MKFQIYLIGLLCLFLKVNAQDKNSNIVLKIGDKVPDITISNISNYQNADGKPITTAKISDFNGKVLILDFWATWCTPCVAMIPKMDSLQKQFAGKVLFIEVAYQKEQEVLPFIAKLEKQQKRHYNIPDVINDSIWVKMFPHSSLPHFVWIGSDGIVKAITDQIAVNAENIIKISKSENINAPLKQEAKLIAYDRQQPLFLDANPAFDAPLIYHTKFTGYIEGIKGGYHWDLYEPGKARRITARNLPIVNLFSLAFSGQNKSLGQHKTLLDVKDSSAITSSKTGAEYHNWAVNGHGFCYELIVPPALAENVFLIMQADLAKFFPQYQAKIETRNRDCWVLTRTSTVDKIKSSGHKPNVQSDRFGFHLTNATLDYLIVQLDSFFLSNSPYPIIDGTGYKGKADLMLDANLGNVQSINKALEKYDLRFVLKKYPVEMLHISDRSPL